MAFPGEQFEVTLTSANPLARLGLAGRYISVERVLINGRQYNRSGFIRLRESASTTRALLLKSGDAVDAGPNTDDVVVNLENDSLDTGETIVVRGRVFDVASQVPDLSPRSISSSQISESVASYVDSSIIANTETESFTVSPSTVDASGQDASAETVVIQAIEIEAQGGGTFDLNVRMESTSPSGFLTVIRKNGISPPYLIGDIQKDTGGLFPVALTYNQEMEFNITNQSGGDNNFFLSAIGYIS